MQSPNLSLRAIYAFVRVVDHGSISAAARELNIATSAVSAAVDQVEAEIGTKLLIRARARGIVPTEQAISLASRFKTLIEDYAQVLNQGKSWVTELTGPFNIGYYTPVAPAFLPQLLAPVLAANDALDISLFEYDNEAVQHALLAGKLDLILFAGTDVLPGIDTTRLLDLPPYVLLAKDDPLADRQTLKVADIKDRPIVQLDLPFARPYLRSIFESQGATFRTAARANNTEMVRSLVGAGAGIAVLNMKPQIDVSYGGKPLVAVPLSCTAPPIRLQIGVLKGRPRKAVNELMELLLRWSRDEGAQKVIVTDRA